MVGPAAGEGAGAVARCHSGGRSVGEETVRTRHPDALRISPAPRRVSGEGQAALAHSTATRAPPRTRASAAASSADTAPRTATTRLGEPPRCEVSMSTPPSRSGRSEGWATARPSRTPAAEAERNRPDSVCSRSSWPWSRRCTATEAATLTADSSDPAGPCPRWARSLVSTRTAPSSRQCCSSRRTISAPCLAVDLQCTRRSSSPCWYSRGIGSCSPRPVIARRGDSSPWDPPAGPREGSGTVGGVTSREEGAPTTRVTRTQPSGSQTLTTRGPIG
ncbi:hypothetical protein BJF83_00215 [Nocardiopsis sp. CNR-923]|nr:hypothetical protein BJF83_00215 [Nocardiopsis sp. CNR-923]